MWYQGGPIDDCTHVPGLFSQSSADSEYNSEFTAVMAPSHSKIINIEVTKKYPDIVPEQAHLLI